MEKELCMNVAMGQVSPQDPGDVEQLESFPQLCVIPSALFFFFFCPQHLCSIHHQLLGFQYSFYLKGFLWKGLTLPDPMTGLGEL